MHFPAFGQRGVATCVRMAALSPSPRMNCHWLTQKLRPLLHLAVFVLPKYKFTLKSPNTFRLPRWHCDQEKPLAVVAREAFALTHCSSQITLGKDTGPSRFHNQVAALALQPHRLIAVNARFSAIAFATDTKTPFAAVGLVGENTGSNEAAVFRFRIK